MHFLEAQQNERLRAQDDDNAQHLEQENERLRIQAEIKPDYTVAARPEEFPKLGQPTAVAVAAVEPETGVLCVMQARDGLDHRRAPWLLRRRAPGPLHLEEGRAPAPGMVIQYKAGRVHRALCLEPVGSEGIPGMPSGRSSIAQTSPAKYNPFPRSALSLNTKFVNNFVYSQK